MRKSELAVAWVVYRMKTQGKGGQTGSHGVVCEQAEWEAMERENPGYYTLVRAGITSESEAENLARTTSGFVATARGARLASRP